MAPMSIERMGVLAEVFPFAADETGIWSLGRCLTPDSVGSDSDPQWEAVQLLLARLPVTEHDVIVLPHTTSVRTFCGHQVNTHVAVLDPGGLPVPERWPHRAKGVDRTLLEDFGPPAPHRADAPPHDVRLADVFQHALRHLAWIARHDRPTRDALPLCWHEHLARIEPDLLRLFETAA
jgi:hypothetical protein